MVRLVLSVAQRLRFLQHSLPSLARQYTQYYPSPGSLRESRQRNRTMRYATDMTAPQHFAKCPPPAGRLSNLLDWLDFAPRIVAAVELVRSREESA